MSDVLQRAQDLIRGRLAELDSERERLTKALQELNGQKGNRSKSRPSSGPTAQASKRSAARRKNVPVSDREKAIVAFIQANPDCKSKDLAKHLRVSPTYLSGQLLSRMRAAGVIGKKDGRHVVLNVDNVGKVSKATNTKSSKTPSKGKQKGKAAKSQQTAKAS